MSIETRVLYLVMPLLIMLLLFVVSFSIGSKIYLSVWLLGLTFSILAEYFSRACKEAFNEKHKLELDEIIEREIIRYGGREYIERDFWKSSASRESLRNIVPDEMIESVLASSSGFWGKVGNLGMFVFVGLPMFAIAVLVYSTHA